MVPGFQGAEARFRLRGNSGHSAHPLERQGALPADRFRVAAAQVHALAASASLRSRDRGGVGQAEFPQEGRGLRPAFAPERNANGGSASSSTTVPLRHRQVRKAQKTRIQLRAVKRIRFTLNHIKDERHVMIGIKFIKVQPTTYLLQYRGGKIVREGLGLSFFYYGPTTSLVAVPVASTDTPFIFQETTADFQAVTIQGQVTYRISEPKRLAALLNYTLEKDGDTYVSEDPEKLPERVIHVINVIARAELQKLPLREAIRASDTLVQAVKARLVAAEEITSLGLEVLGLSILAIKPTPETARALEADTRERLFREADEATYARRNSAVEQERAIKENELNTEIAVETKKRQIRETQMDAERAVQEKEGLLKKEALETNIGLEERRKNMVALAADNAKAEADARAYGVSSTMKALGSADTKILQALASTGMRPEQLIAFAFQELAGKAEKIGQLNISPDLLRELLTPQPARK